MIASYAGCDRLLVVICLITATAFKGNYYPGMRVNAIDLSPNYAGTIIAISNGAAAASGIAVPTFIGYMTPDVRLLTTKFSNTLLVNIFTFTCSFQSTLEQWRLVFWFALGVSVLRTIIYLIWASADVQPWNKPKETESPEIVELTESKI